MLLVGASVASAQTITAYTGVPFNFTVDVPGVPDDNIEWEIYSDFAGINMAVIPGNCPPASGAFVSGDNIGASVDIVWEVPGLYIVKVHATNSCPTDNMKFYLVEVLQSLPTATLLDPVEICAGEPAVVIVELTGDAPWDLILTDGVNVWNFNNILASPATLVLSPSPTTTSSLTVTSVTNIDGTNTEPSNTVTLIVNPLPVNSNIYQYSPP